MFVKTNINGLRSHTSFFGYSNKSFEYACKYLLEEIGYAPHAFVTKKGPKGGDGGIDLKITSHTGDIISYGQCKQWRTHYNSLIKIIRELKGCMAFDGIEKGVLIVTCHASDFEKKLAKKGKIDLIDASRLDTMIKSIQEKKLNRPTPANV